MTLETVITLTPASRAISLSVAILTPLGMNFTSARHAAAPDRTAPPVALRRPVAPLTAYHTARQKSRTFSRHNGRRIIPEKRRQEHGPSLPAPIPRGFDGADHRTGAHAKKAWSPVRRRYSSSRLCSASRSVLCASESTRLCRSYGSCAVSIRRAGTTAPLLLSAA